MYRIVCFLFLIVFFISCTNKSNYKLINRAVGCHDLDQQGTAPELWEKLKSDTTQLILNKDMTFRIKSTNVCLNQLNGKWDIQEGWELNSYVFDFGGGRVQESAIRNIVVNNDCGMSGVLSFNMKSINDNSTNEKK